MGDQFTSVFTQVIIFVYRILEQEPIYKIMRSLKMTRKVYLIGTFRNAPHPATSDFAKRIFRGKETVRNHEEF